MQLFAWSIVFYKLEPNDIGKLALNLNILMLNIIIYLISDA